MGITEVVIADVAVPIDLNLLTQVKPGNCKDKAYPCKSGGVAERINAILTKLGGGRKDKR